MAYENLIRLVEVMDRLRSPGGCPWDAEQSHESLLKYLLEESYEFIESVENNDRAHMREELGDLLLQVYFHSRIPEENATDPFTIDDVAAAVAEKLISRHPHVFGDTKVDNSQDVLENWEKIKNSEKGRTSVVDGVPLGQPALPLASKLIYRAEKNRGETPPLPDYEIEESEEALGSQFLSLISWAVSKNLDPEAALRKAALKYRDSLLSKEPR